MENSNFAWMFQQDVAIADEIVDAERTLNYGQNYCHH